MSSNHELPTHLYQAIFQSATTMMVILSSELEIIDANRIFKEYCIGDQNSGIKNEALNYLSYRQIHQELTSNKLPPIEKIEQFIDRPQTPSSTKLGVTHHEKIIRWEIQRIKHVERYVYVLLGSDITRYQQAKDKIYELDSVIAQLPGNVYWYSKELIYLGCNENSAKTLNLTRKEAKGQDFKELMRRVKDITEEVIEQFVADGEEVIKTGKPKLNIEEPPFVGPDGKISYWIANKVPLKNKDGDVYGVVGISTDITQLKQLEKQLIETEAREVRFKAMSALGGMIAHELRTPLRAIDSGTRGIYKRLPALIQGYKQAISHHLIEATLLPRQYENLLILCQRIEVEIRSGFTFIDMMLSNIKNTVSMKPGEFVLLDMNQCVEEALQRYPFDEVEKTLVHWDKDINFTFRGNALMVMHIFFNLIKNALYYIKAVNRGTIAIWTESDKQFNQLHFKDTGKGISKASLPNIFECFYSTTYHGAGLGLAFCKTVMEAMGGKIECVSKEGEYTEFILFFPVVVS